ncbi:MAG: hypothetical protein HYV32_00625 [Candidatus Kerfeldbacteria bacterium]|nr:hypothetical protein [Candidatus Kerfeldbacteria bacterium]
MNEKYPKRPIIIDVSPQEPVAAPFTGITTEHFSHLPLEDRQRIEQLAQKIEKEPASFTTTMPELFMILSQTKQYKELVRLANFIFQSKYAQEQGKPSIQELIAAPNGQEYRPIAELLHDRGTTSVISQQEETGVIAAERRFIDFFSTHDCGPISDNPNLIMQLIMLRALKDPEADLYGILDQMTPYQVYKNLHHVVEKLANEQHIDAALSAIDHYLIDDYQIYRKEFVRKYILNTVRTEQKDRAIEIAQKYDIPPQEIEELFKPRLGKKFDY